LKEVYAVYEKLQRTLMAGFLAEMKQLLFEHGKNYRHRVLVTVDADVESF
jgi:hypothetical protein